MAIIGPLCPVGRTPPGGRSNAKPPLTSRVVRHTYWSLAHAIAALEVHKQSLELARQSLHDTRAPVASEDALRALVYDSGAGFPGPVIGQTERGDALRKRIVADHVHVGPQAVAFAVLLNKRFGLPYGKIAALFRDRFHLTLDATNWRAEHALRPAVVTRKMCGGGNRTRRGADRQQVLASVLRTADQRGLDATDVLVALLTAPTPIVSPSLRAIPAVH